MYNNSDFLSDSTEERGCFVSTSKSIGYEMIFKILSDKSSKIIHYSNVRPADIPLDINIYLNLLMIPSIVNLQEIY